MKQFLLFMYAENNEIQVWNVSRSSFQEVDPEGKELDFCFPTVGLQHLQSERTGVAIE